MAGDSAGGGIVLSVLVSAREADLPLPSCAVVFSPWTDLAATGASIRGNDGRCEMFRPENMAQFASAYLGVASRRDPRASPFYADLGGLPPLLIQVGDTELLLDDAVRVHQRIELAGGRSTLSIFHEVLHCWQMLVGLVPEADVALREATEFIRSHAGRRTPD